MEIPRQQADLVVRPCRHNGQKQRAAVYDKMPIVKSRNLVGRRLQEVVGSISTTNMKHKSSQPPGNISKYVTNIYETTCFHRHTLWQNTLQEMK